MKLDLDLKKRLATLKLKSPAALQSRLEYLKRKQTVQNAG